MVHQSMGLLVYGTVSVTHLCVLLCRSKLTMRIANAEHDGTDSRDFSWLLKALDQLRTARQVCCS